ncbi:MAG: universal stress protein [Bacteroidales bacterium]|nr:universal stress protein [Bacteroidales bacterium]
MTFKTILHATDFSDASLRALEQARKLARHHGAKLHVLHVEVLLEARYPALAIAAVTSQREQSEQQLQMLLSRTGDSEIVQATVKHARAAVAIAEYAESNDVDLIVVGSHGYSGIDRLLMGSEARKLIRYATAPVLVVRSRDTASGTAEAPFSRLLAPVDFSEASLMALRKADELATRYAAKLAVVHSLDVVAPTHYTYASPNTQLPLARQALARFISDAALTTEPDQLISSASAAVSILETAESQDSDLIVMARSGMSGLQRFLVGSTTERVLNAASCDVLVLPAV